LHDTITAEKKGVPAIGVMTTRFVTAHPISSAADAHLADCARATLDQARRLLLSA